MSTIQPLQIGQISVEELLAQYGSPLYVMDQSVVIHQVEQLKQGFSRIPVQIHYAMKANYNPAVLRLFLQHGIGLDTVSPMEIQLALQIGFRPDQIVFTGNNASLQELLHCHDLGVTLNIGSLYSLEQFGQQRPGSEISIRINPGFGSGHHAHCITGGPQSKFGIYHDQLDQVEVIIQKHHLKLIGVHCHIGTGILSVEPMLEAVDLIFSRARRFENLKFIDIGGGFSIPYKPEEQALDIQALGQSVAQRYEAFAQEYGSRPQLKIEPGRYLVAAAGTLLTTVTNLKHTPKYAFVGVDSGFNHLIRPTMYGAYHRILNASRPQGAQKDYVVTGNICESGDIFSKSKDSSIERELTEVRVGDCLAILDVGAYGMSMSMEYNLRPRPAEVMVNSAQSRLIRKRDTFEDLTHNFC